MNALESIISCFQFSFGVDVCCSFLKINADAVWFGSVNNVHLGFGQVNDKSFLKSSKRFFRGFSFFKSKQRENKLSLRFIITKQLSKQVLLLKSPSNFYVHMQYANVHYKKNVVLF